MRIGQDVRTHANLLPGFVFTLAPISFRGHPRCNLLFHDPVPKQSTGVWQIVWQNLAGCGSYSMSARYLPLVLPLCIVTISVHPTSHATRSNISAPNILRLTYTSLVIGWLSVKPVFCTSHPALRRIYSPKVCPHNRCSLFRSSLNVLPNGVPPRVRRGGGALELVHCLCCTCTCRVLV